MRLIKSLPGELFWHQTRYKKDREKWKKRLVSGIEAFCHLHNLVDMTERLSHLLTADGTDELCIVAPGKSLGALTEKSYEWIDNRSSILFNASCFSRIHGDIYFLEIWNESEISRQLHNCVAKLVELERIKARQIVFKNLWSKGNYSCSESPLLRNNEKPGYIRDILLPASRTRTGLRKGIERYLPVNAGDIKEYWLQYGSTLFLSAYLGCLAGFKNIIFVGADLVGSGYFYERRAAVPLELRDLLTFSQPRVRAHATLKTSFMRANIVEALSLLEGRFREDEVRFWAPHERSALASVFPVWERLAYT